MLKDPPKVLFTRRGEARRGESRVVFCRQRCAAVFDEFFSVVVVVVDVDVDVDVQPFIYWHHFMKHVKSIVVVLQQLQQQHCVQHVLQLSMGSNKM